MAQVKIYGFARTLNPIKAQLSEVIHSCVVEALRFPPDKRAHRFFPLGDDDFYYPPGRTDQYTIIEISLFEGRAVETKKLLIRLLFERINEQLGITPQDVEITISETPPQNRGFRGLPGDEISLNYQIEV